MKNLPLAARNVWHVIVNRVAKVARQGRRRLLRGVKPLQESGKHVRAQLQALPASTRDAGARAYRGGVRSGRYWRRVQTQAASRVARDVQARLQLRAAARGARPVIAGPWLSEVGYEALYWLPFLRWACDRYHIAPERLVVVSRGGVAAWYAGLTTRYVELLDLMSPEEFAERNAARQRAGDQKQSGLADLDQEILRRVRALPGLAGAGVCHPATMFRLLRQFWLGNESLQYLLGHLHFSRVTAPPVPASIRLPERFVAVKFYTGKALPPTETTYAQLRALVGALAARVPVVTLETGLTLDEHRDFSFRDVPGVLTIPELAAPATNLGVQTAIIGRADAFIGTCGSLAWLAPALGTPTVGVYADDEWLTPHLYAAGVAYRAVGAAPFSAMSLHALAQVDAERYDPLRS